MPDPTTVLCRDQDLSATADAGSRKPGCVADRAGQRLVHQTLRGW